MSIHPNTRRTPHQRDVAAAANRLACLEGMGYTHSRCSRCGHVRVLAQAGAECNEYSAYTADEMCDGTYQPGREQQTPQDTPGRGVWELMNSPIHVRATQLAQHFIAARADGEREDARRYAHMLEALIEGYFLALGITIPQDLIQDLRAGIITQSRTTALHLSNPQTGDVSVRYSTDGGAL